MTSDYQISWVRILSNWELAASNELLANR